MNEAVSVLSNRDDAESLNQLSRAYFAMEQWDDAVKYGERAVSLEPGNANYHLWLAREYGRKAGDSNPLAAAGLARKAKSEFERAVQLDPANVARPGRSGAVLHRSPRNHGRWPRQGARTSCSRWLSTIGYGASDPGARCRRKRNDMTRPRANSGRRSRTRSNPADMWLQLAAFYRQRGRLEDMQNAVQCALAQPGKPAYSYFDAASELYLGSRDFPGAVPVLAEIFVVGRTG